MKKLRGFDIEYYIFVFNEPATTEIYTYWHTLSLHYALPISVGQCDSLIADRPVHVDQAARQRAARGGRHFDRGNMQIGPRNRRHVERSRQETAIVVGAVLEQIGRASCRERVCP